MGLPYVARMETLPLYSADLRTDGKPKRVVGAQMMLEHTRGLHYGVKGQELFETKDSSFDLIGGPLGETESPVIGLVACPWSLNQQLVFEQPYPLPAALLAFLSESEFGV